MDAAARLALRGRPASSPNPSVGTILVRDGRVIARGWTQGGGRPHAEAHALSNLSSGEAAGATAYVTLEPCAHRSERGPACAELLAQAKPTGVVIGILDPDSRTAGQGVSLLEDAGIEVTVLESASARESLAGYLTRAERGRPHVTLKIAMSLDGCIALADGTSQWITGDEARAHVHSRRALSDAILVGGGTWRADKPRLDVRLQGLEHRSPRRVLLTRGVAPDGVKVINAPEQISTLDGVQYLYIEGGAEVSASFLKADLVDRLEIYRAPIIIGDGLRAIGDLGLTDLPAAHGRWAIAEKRQLGSDTFTAYQRTR
ncbi:bifunctional diaminohydroxyphosphoribosylaminopyrimidine deaminase/5-amino-6-(5-phosphoribosylamino)uracil reductase RibD [Altererythrobacter lutimaris]|uniref:Riboflavin biosynthesis protein RibD n=1 Tax=Altererythrobacter lutimaris TaxID=2743979 RepID=A0A850HBJ3_9SPHN|nr:bifunctional diaminohydroxyphosphoribosylaminopyrimidine deaminase/5-amino-6-(5-phosphoribosylamino)uracil reductase RibD [Altererythrobacter lutimaris]NVE94910.1 bifunctional diaminohydroxyphosphoribosylaminopyrimidine deaminase/5-amino-6-(5-phosphoribosylamino)uracil reductase RibD [Altererythrobacter lutimaris]